eukprot:scaffold4.g4659.t1
MKTEQRNAARLCQVLTEMCVAVQQNEAYAEEARAAGAVELLTKLFKRTDDEQVLDLASDVIAACSGPMASSRKLSTFTYGGHSVAIQEGALGDGVGSKVWTVAHIVCRELAAYPRAVEGARVLELGAGTGVCGILAAKLGARRVLLTDYTDGVLRNLRDCMHLNAPPPAPRASAGSEGAKERRGQEHADGGEVAPRGGSCGAVAPSSERPWEAGAMAVRFLDWTDSLEQVGEAAPRLGRAIAAASHTSLDSLDRASNESRAPRVDPGERFDLLLGTDVLYEWPMVDTLAAAVAHRMAPRGRTLLCCAVREGDMFRAFRAATAQLGLRMGLTAVQPRAEDLASVGVQAEYESLECDDGRAASYVLMALEHAAAPAPAWHRGGLFPAAEG